MNAASTLSPFVAIGIALSSILREEVSNLQLYEYLEVMYNEQSID